MTHFSLQKQFTVCDWSVSNVIHFMSHLVMWLSVVEVGEHFHQQQLRGSFAFTDSFLWKWSQRLLNRLEFVFRAVYPLGRANTGLSTKCEVIDVQFFPLLGLVRLKEVNWHLTSPHFSVQFSPLQLLTFIESQNCSLPDKVSSRLIQKRPKRMEWTTTAPVQTLLIFKNCSLIHSCLKRFMVLMKLL
jgi:hypothetical protein